MQRLDELLFVATLLCASQTWGDAMDVALASTSQHRNCIYQYAYEMYGAHCAGLQYERIPELKAGIEILVFSSNWLQKLSADTLSRYTSVRYLYLDDNKIFDIDEDALTQLTSLETLDLSNNAVQEVPSSLFRLPSLRKLYLKGNPIFHRNNNPTIPRPIKAPLELLDISRCNLHQLPAWGALPQLKLYNISNNPLSSISAGHFAGMCSLAKVDLSASTDDVKLCSFKPITSWFHEKSIFLQLKDEEYNKLNSADFKKCPEEDNSVHNITYHLCKAEYLQVQRIKTSRRTWLTISGGLAGFLIGFILLLYVMHRFNVARTKTTVEKIKQSTPAHDPDKNARTVLLNEHEMSRL